MFLPIRRRLPPIPALKPVDGWKQLPINECGEPLVPLGFFSDYPQILFDPIYFGTSSSSPYNTGQLEGALMTPFVRRGIAERLKRASRRLPKGLAFLIWDAYRPVEVQSSLFWWYVNDVLVGEQGMGRDEAIEAAQQFVSYPSEDPSCPPPHNTGGTVDLTIVRFDPEAWRRMRQLDHSLSTAKRSGDELGEFEIEMERWTILRDIARPINMGTVFDMVCDATATRFYEDASTRRALTFLERRQLENRRLLYWTMNAVGLSSYPDEWWHFDHANQFATARVGGIATYGAALFSEANRFHEEVMRSVFEGVVSAWEGKPHPRQRGKMEHPLRSAVVEIVRRTGDLRTSQHPQAARL